MEWWWIKSEKKKQKTEKEWKESNHMFYVGSDLSKWKKKEKTIHFVGGAVDRYRADFGLSTFNDGRGIFDWNVDETDGAVPVVFNVDGGGGGGGATATDGETPRLVVPPVRFPLLWVITGLLVVAAVVLACELGVRDRGAAGDKILPVCGLGVGNLAVTADKVFRCDDGVGFVLVNKEFILRDNVERIVSVDGGVVVVAVAAGWTIGCVKVFDARLDIVITHSRALGFGCCILIVDVFNCSSICAGIAGGL